jgi:lipid A 3-O-deacylase
MRGAREESDNLRGAHVRHTRSTLGLVVGLVVGLALAMAGVPAGAARAADGEPAFLSLGVGYYDIVHQDDPAADFRLEYRHDRGVWLLKPWAGVEATSDGAVYGVGGIYLDLVVMDHLAVTPSFGVGAYANGGGRDLGNTVEFRSQIELAYRFQDRSRLGVAFGHISNAGLGDINPGVEILDVYYHLPFTTLFGN